MTYTVKGLIDLLGTDEVNSKGKVIEALRNASSQDLIGFRNDINRVIITKRMHERKSKDNGR